jgi:NTE family protein
MTYPNSKCTALLSLLVISLVGFTDAKKCRALALRGGGTKGSYEVGVLKAFSEHLPPEEIMYDVVVGVSIGAMNGGAFSLFPLGEEKEAIEYLEQIWATIDHTNMFQDWGWYALEAFFK